MSKPNDLTVGQSLVLIAICLVLIPVIIAISALIFQLVIWNGAVVGLGAALGASVGKIGFWTAVAAGFLIAKVRGIFRDTSASKALSDYQAKQ